MVARRLLTLGGVLAAHALIVASLWMSRVSVWLRDPPPITVRLIAEQHRPQDPLPPPAPVDVHLVAPRPSAALPDIPVIALSDAQPEAAHAPANTVPAVAAASSATAATTLSGELELQCPERHAPRYPPAARHEHAQGEVRMRVEIDESGRIASVSIIASSGSQALDEAARAAIQSWRCLPAERDGRPVRAVALQTMDFVLQRR